MANLSFADSVRTFTSNSTGEIEDQATQGYITACNNLNASSPLASIVIGNNVVTVTFKNGHTFTITITAGTPPSFDVATQGPFTQAQFYLFVTLSQALQAMGFGGSLTSLNDTYN